MKNKDYVFPKEFEVIIHYLDGEHQSCVHTETHDSLNNALRTIRHIRVQKGSEILKYEINIQRVLV